MDPRIKPIPIGSRPPPRGLGTLLALTVLGTALLAVLLTACGGGGGGGGAAPPTQQPAAADGTLAASQPGELLAYAKAKLGERQAQRSQAGSNDVAFGSIVLTASSLGTASAPGAVAAATGVERSGTTVQESGVDEDDVIKSDGSLFVTMARELAVQPGRPGATVSVHRRLADGTPQRAGSITLMAETDAATYYRGLYYASAAQRVALLGEDQFFYTLDFCNGLPTCASAAILPYPRVSKPRVQLDLLSTADPAAPTVRERWRIDGTLIGSRLIGNSLVLVTQHAPRLAVDALPWNAPAAEREALLARLTTAELLPTITVDGAAAQALVAETDCYVEPKNASDGLEITTITTVDLASPTLQRRSRCFIGGSEALYMSPQALYLATTRHSYTLSSRIAFPPQMNTDIHKFALAGGTVDYRGSGTVNGHLGWDSQSRSYRLSEHNGDLRVLTFTGQTGWAVPADANSGPVPVSPSPATLTVLREASATRALTTVATLPNSQRPAPIGKAGEQVHAVRFIGERGYVVTFRRTDPLYVLDLSTPTDPRTVGELEVAGFSNYLFPVGPPTAPGSLLLGVGRDADDRGVATGVKLALFDVSDPARPAQRASVTLGNANTQAALEASRHGIDLFTRSGQTRVVLPVAAYSAVQGLAPFSLQRFEIDGAARTMLTKPALAASDPPWRDMDLQRTLQIGEQVYFWDGAQLKVFAW